MSDKIAWDFNSSEATRVVALDISKTFERVWLTGPLNKFKFYVEYQVKQSVSFYLFLIIDVFKLFWIESQRKNIQLLELFRASFLLLQFSDYMLMTFVDYVIRNITIYADDTIDDSTMSVSRHLCEKN